jgi:hypothetical protein
MPIQLVKRGNGLLAKDGSLSFGKPCNCCGQPCDTEAFGGGAGTTVNIHSMPAAAGEVRFFYEAYRVSDAFLVEGGGQVFIDTGDVSGSAALTFCKPEGLRSVRVTVTGPQGTIWRYEIGCPGSPCTPAPRGVGAEMTDLLSRFWIRHSPDCACAERAARLDEMGPDWARENIDLVLEWMREEAARRGLPFVELAARWVVNEAIRRAEAADSPPK